MSDEDDVLRVRCPECGKKYKVEPPMKFRCKECETIVEVDEDGKVTLPKSKGKDKEKDKERSRTRDVDEERSDSKRSKKGESRRKSTRREKRPEPKPAESGRQKSPSKRVDTRAKSDDGEGRRGSSRRMKSGGSSDGERGSSRRGRAGARGGSSKSSTGLYVGIGVAVVAVLGIAAFLTMGAGSSSEAAPSATGEKKADAKGILAEMSVSSTSIPFCDRAKVTWTLTNNAGKDLTFNYKTRLRYKILDEESTGQPKGKFDTGAPRAEEKEQSTLLVDGGRHMGTNDEISIESLDLDDSQYAKLTILVWVEYEPQPGSDWTEGVSSNHVEVQFHSPSRAELQTYVENFASEATKDSEKRRMIAMVARHSISGFEEFFQKAMDDKAPSVKILAAEYALERKVSGAAEKIQSWKRAKIEDAALKSRLDALLQKTGG